MEQVWRAASVGQVGHLLQQPGVWRHWQRGTGNAKTGEDYVAAPRAGWCLALCTPEAGGDRGEKQARTWMLLRESMREARTLVRSASGSLKTPPSLPLCRSRSGPATCVANVGD